MSPFDNQAPARENPGGAGTEKSPGYEEPVSAAAVEAIFADCGDLAARDLAVGGTAGTGDRGVTAFFLDGLADGVAVAEDVFRPLTEGARFSGLGSGRACMDAMLEGGVYAASVHESKTLDDVVTDVLNGFCVLVFDREAAAIAFETRSGVARAIDVPGVEKSVKGPKDSFVETLRTNTSLVRRHLRNPDLKIVETKVGRRSGTAVALCYIGGLTDMSLVAEMRRRVDGIDIDGLISPGNLEEYLLDRPRSFAPQALHTERPDRFCMNLLEGRVGVLADGIPHGLLMPVNFHQFFKFPEDNAYHFVVGNMLMALRYIALAVSTLFPALAVAVSMYHQEMIPTRLLLSMVANAQKVPFGEATEVLGLLLAFLLLQEAQTRLPTAIGDTISLIGALILGQAAVEAKIVSPISVIIFAAAAISGYTAGDMDLSMACRLIRILMVFAAIFLGLFGVVAGLVLIVHHLCSVESLGVPYMIASADGQQRGLWRALLRVPLRRKKYRPQSLNTQDKRNQA